MAQPGRIMETPTVYVVGEDFTQEWYQELVLRVGDWLAETRKNLKEPNVAARQVLECCLRGVKPSDPSQQWRGVERATFAARVRIACRFDTEKMEGIRKASEKNKVRKEKEKNRNAEKRRKSMDDPNIPDEIRKELQGSAKYGDDPRVFLSSEEANRWQDLHDGYVNDFPELATINAAAELNLLCDLLIVSERQRMKILKGEKVDPYDQKGVTEQIIQLKKALNIHPEQLAKRVQQQTAGTVGELVRRMEEMGIWAEIRDKFWVEELLMLFQMYNSPSPRENMGGYQLDEVGFFGQTRCRTCACAKCGHRNVMGLSQEEVEEFLKKRGVLQEIEDAETAARRAGLPIVNVVAEEPDAGTES